VDNARLHHELQEAVRTRDEFVAAASHDLKNPLASIKGTAQVLQRRTAREGQVEPERLTAGLARIDTAATRMSRLVDLLLDTARLQTGSPLELDRRPTDLFALAEQVADESRPATERHALRVEGERGLIGQWDAARLERVLGNLLDNAIKYSPDGGEVVVRLARDADAAGTWAVLTVRDQGIGIPPADLPRIFDRFQRGGNVIGRIGGTGIGLAGARQIVEQHGGTIAVESQAGGGTTVRVRLPLDDPNH
jgi:signal transduction histidine kinase